MPNHPCLAIWTDVLKHVVDPFQEYLIILLGWIIQLLIWDPLSSHKGLGFSLMFGERAHSSLFWMILKDSKGEYEPKSCTTRCCSKFGTSTLNCYLIANFISCFMMSYDVLRATNHPAETAPQRCREVSTGCSTDPVVSNFSEISEPSRRALLRRPEEWNQ